MYGASILPSRAGLVLLVCGLVFFLFFLKRMLRMENPLFDIRLFSGNRVFAFSNIAALINYAATYSVAFLLSLYLQYIKGMTPSEAGIVMVTQPLLQAILSPFTGRLSDRIEPGLLASGGMFSTALGLALFIFLGRDTPMIMVVFALLLLGLGFAFFSSPNTNAIMGSVPARHYGVASGSVGTMRVLGQMTSMGIITVVFALFLGEGRITPDHYGTFLVMVRICFSISAMLCLVGVYFSFFRGNLHGGKAFPEVPEDSL
jgi:MFS family permease